MGSVRLEVLYLVRHGKAEGSHPQGDRHRALSAEGRERIARMKDEASRLGFQADLALSSPYQRAVETRDLFQPVVAASRTETSRALTPDGDPDEAWAEVLAWAEAGYPRIAVFSHNPFVTEWADRLLVPGALSNLVFHTPTILALTFPDGVAWRKGRPLWTLHP